MADNACKYCGKVFLRDITLFRHICEPQRRHLAKNEKHVRIGYQTFVRFYELSQGSDTKKSYDEFTQSPYYNAFVKFGSFVNNTAPLYPKHFIDWVIKSKTRVDYWCTDDLYNKYVIELIQSESVETAIERSIKHMQKWADATNNSWNKYFVDVSINRFINDVKDGRISPWLILNCDNGKKLVSSLLDEQINLIIPIINPTVWSLKFKLKPDDVALVKHVVNEGEL
jgi:hypothetical protein